MSQMAIGTRDPGQPPLLIRTCWELLHPVTGVTIGFEWIDREATAVNPPPPAWIRVPVQRVLVLGSTRRDFKLDARVPA